MKNKPNIIVVGDANIGLAACTAIAANTADVGMVVCSIDLSSMDESNKQLIHLIPVNENSEIVGVDGRTWKYNAGNVLANAKKTSVKIPGDYHHASMNARETGATAPASGWIDPATLTAQPDGIWGEVEWTQTAANAIRNKEFLYTSPVFTHSKISGEILALKGFALTHYPNLGDLTPVANAQNMEEEQMEEQMEELLERFKYMLNLAELATPEEILAEMEKAITRIKSMMANEASEAATAQNSSLVDLLGQLETEMTQLAANAQDVTDFVPRHEFDSVRTALNAMQSEKDETRVATAVNSALEAGVIAPASKDWAENYCRKDSEGFAAFAANAQKVVPMGEDTHGADPANSLTHEEIAMCSQLGITQDDYKKTKDLEVNHGIN